MALIGLIFTVLGGLAGSGSLWYAYTADSRAKRLEEQQTGHITRRRPQVRGLSRWSRINILVSVTAVGIFAIGIFLIIQSGSSPLPRPPAAGPTASTSINSPKPSNTDTQSTSSSSATWSDQFGPKPLLITDGSLVNLDQVPPNVNADGAVIFQFSNNQLFDYDDLVKWTGTGTGTANAAACSDLINEQGVQYAKPVVNDTYCAKTDQGNIAILTVQRINVDGTGNMTSVLVQTTVWVDGTPNPPPSATWSDQFGPKPLLITDGSLVNLDQVPPNVNADGAVIFQFSNNQLFDYDDLVKWTGTGTGTANAAACSDLINEQGVQYAKPVVNDTYCAKTDQGNIAILTVQRINVDGTGNMTSVLVQTTVWTSS